MGREASGISPRLRPTRVDLRMEMSKELRGLGAERTAAFGVFLLLAWPAWLRGGTVPGLMRQLPGLALACLLVWLLRVAAGPHRGRSWRRLVDPVVLSGVFFIVLITLQWWNAGRTLMFDAGAWFYGPARHPRLPSAVTPEEAHEMLLWFIPAFAILWLLHFGIRRRETLLGLYKLVLLNAVLVSLFGLVQFASGTEAIYGRVPTRAHFFAGFGYANHAGAYFVLMFSLTIGLGMREFLRTKPPRRALCGVLYSAAGLACFAAIQLSLSRAAIVCSWVLCGLFVGYLYTRFFSSLSPAARFNSALICVAIAGLAFFLVSGVGRGSVRREVTTLTPGRVLRSLTEGRWFQTRSALSIWADHPAFGTGGWGYRYFAPLYIPRADWARITHDGEDLTITANVHNDLAQFLAEFGAVGTGLLVLTVLLVVAPVFRSRPWQKPLLLFPLTGVALVLIHSFIDLPFRSPAVLYAWLCLLAGSGKLAAPARNGYGLNSAAAPKNGAVARSLLTVRT